MGSLNIPEVNIKSLKTKILTKQGSDMMQNFIPTKYHKYPSNTILKHENVLAPP